MRKVPFALEVLILLEFSPPFPVDRHSRRGLDGGFGFATPSARPAALREAYLGKPSRGPSILGEE